MTQFSDLGLADPLLRAVTAEGYTTPTPIQGEVIPAMLGGADLLGIAQTGTGKTAAFVLPLLQRVLRQRSRPGPKRCTGLILAPTRELANQIAVQIRACGKYMKIRSAVIVGGTKHGPQVRALSAGPDIVVATPGRLIDHLERGGLSLDRTSAVVLDEADHMLDLGFVVPIRRILSLLPEERQTVMLSATMPKQIRAIARDFQTEPQEIAVAAVSRPVERIAQSVRHLPQDAKRHALNEILTAEGDDARAIVFTRTKRGADRVAQQLKDAGLSAAAIHGDKPQVQRERALAAFRAGRTGVLVATDIAARGIDIDNVTLVVNYDLPQVAEAYVHRIGRTARAGREGTAITLCAPAEFGLLRDIEKLIGKRLDSEGPVPQAPGRGAAGDRHKGKRWRGKDGAPKRRFGDAGASGKRHGRNKPGEKDGIAAARPAKGPDRKPTRKPTRKHASAGQGGRRQSSSGAPTRTHA